MNANNGIVIRVLSSIEEYEQVGELQRDIWGAMEILPPSLLLTMQKNGGLVAGAYTHFGQMIGVVLGFVGRTKSGKFKHCSHQMGMLAEYRRQGIGEALKRFQRDYLLTQDTIDLVTWTFDPLEGVNAFLNIARLGGIVRTYFENHYGDMPDALNKGLRSDRFELEWWIASHRVNDWLGAERERPTHSALGQRGAQTINETTLDNQGALRPVKTDLSLDAETLLVEIPAEFQAIKAVSMDLAREWRMHTSAIFQHYFANGYFVTDFISEREDNRRRNFYILTKTPLNL